MQLVSMIPYVFALLIEVSGFPGKILARRHRAHEYREQIAFAQQWHSVADLLMVPFVVAVFALVSVLQAAAVGRLSSGDIPALAFIACVTVLGLVALGYSALAEDLRETPMSGNNKLKQVVLVGKLVSICGSAVLEFYVL